jgi:antitoxin component of MazEF toxin-antitoxin module
MKLKFNAQVWKTGNSYVITIPNDYVKNGQIPENTELSFSVEVSDVT